MSTVHTQFSLWLYPLILVSLITMVLYARIGLSWGWSGVVQGAVTLALGVVGLFFGPDWLFAILGWSFFLLRALVPTFLLRRLATNLTLYRPDQAERDADLLAFFQWGKPGRLWKDVARALGLYLNDQADRAEQVLQPWREQKMPRQFEDTVQSTTLMGRVVRHDWDGIIKQFTELRADNKRISYSMTTYASRAFAERRLIQQSLSCLEASNVPATRVHKESRAQLFIPFFALSGAMDDLMRLLDGLPLLPEYAKLSWMARCEQSRGHRQRARELLQRSLNLIGDSNPLWKRRLLEQQEKFEAQSEAPVLDWSDEIARARRLMERATIVGEIISPSRVCVAVTALVIAISVAYVVSHAYDFYKSDTIRQLENLIYYWGALDERFLKGGEWWRCITFLFLHAHVSHLLMNLIGLWWFGRMAENMFGSAWFVFLYFVSGAASAVAQIVAAPAMFAVGASGSVMGLFGAVIAAFFRCKHIIPDRIRRFELSLLIGFALAQILLDQFVPRVATFAHLGGLLTGLVLGFIVPLRGIVRLASEVKHDLSAPVV